MDLRRNLSRFSISHYITSAAVVGGIAFAALNLTTQPLFPSLDQFVLVAENRIHLAGDVQVSSGDLASNKEIAIAGNNIINGNLFSDAIKIAGDTQINGGASFNELKLTQNSEILGATSTPISLPIIELPDLPDFTPGNQDLIVQEDQVISPGDFNKLEVKEGITLTLNPGTYNLNEFALRDSSKLLFTATTTINIKQTLKINKNVLIAPNTNISPTALTFNIKSESKTVGKGKQESKGVQLVTIGEDSFISFKLLAPNSKVILGERTTFRGQILAGEIQVGGGSILSREDVFVKESDPEKVVTDATGVKLIVNEILLLFELGTPFSEAVGVAELVNGTITGFIPAPPIYKIEVVTETPEELDSKIQLIKNVGVQSIIEVSPNFISESPLISD